MPTATVWGLVKTVIGGFALPAYRDGLARSTVR